MSVVRDPSPISSWISSAVMGRCVECQHDRGLVSDRSGPWNDHVTNDADVAPVMQCWKMLVLTNAQLTHAGPNPGQRYRPLVNLDQRSLRAASNWAPRRCFRDPIWACEEQEYLNLQRYLAR